ncbi:hypothetical protein L1987_37890 [Smallanthus sonchifolius]|uniref:Uncharacterized protein n=1 Tax=Smallanthus sonchifolius TaxID=185202 RepID=A0ACB9HIW1_9ASTR|nr:hypothetical protein L1987_37890 [Smallanthus sonchifolius]
MSEAVNFQGIINFLNRSLHQDTDVKPHILRATVNNTEVAISVETIRAALALGGANEDPMSYPGTLVMECFQRMGYRGRPNDTQARKGGLVGEWMYFMHVIIQSLSPRKAGTDGLKSALQAAMVALTLNKRFNISLYIYRELVRQISLPEGQGSNSFAWSLNQSDYIEPPNDNWFHPEELVQGQVQNQKQKQPQQVQAQEDVAQENEQDLGVNMEDFDNEAVNSPIHEAEGNVVDTSSGKYERIDDKDNKVIVSFYDAMNLINFSKKDQGTLRKIEIMFTDEWREQGLQYKRVLEICQRYGVHAGSRLPDNWKSSS